MRREESVMENEERHVERQEWRLQRWRESREENGRIFKDRRRVESEWKKRKCLKKSK